MATVLTESSEAMIDRRIDVLVRKHFDGGLTQSEMVEFQQLQARRSRMMRPPPASPRK